METPQNRTPVDWPGPGADPHHHNQPATDPERLAVELAAGAVRVRTLGDVLRDYARWPEHKSLAPDGTRASGTTTGQPRPQQLESHPAMTILTGKEGNNLLERLSGEVIEPSEYRSDIGARVDPWRSLVVPVLPAMGAAVAAHAAGCSRWAVERAIRERGGTVPHPELQTRLTQAAASWARAGSRTAVPETDFECLYSLLHGGASEVGFRMCACVCGGALSRRQSRWVSDACRKRAGRRD